MSRIKDFTTVAAKKKATPSEEAKEEKANISAPGP